MALKYILFVFCVILYNIGIVESQMRCYACSFSAVDTDRSCLTVTNSTPSVDCNFQYCTITRQEYLDPPGHIASFMRGCEEEPDFLNHDVEDANFRTFYRACTSEFCNTGDGIQSVVGGNLQARPVYTGENLLIRGTGRNYAEQLKINVLTSLGFVLTLLYGSL